MNGLHTDLFSLERMRKSELERNAYISGNHLLAKLIVESEDNDDEIDGLEDRNTELAEELSTAYQDLDDLQEKHDQLLTDIQTAMDWIDSDKCKSLEACRELTKRLRQRLIDHDLITTKGTP